MGVMGRTFSIYRSRGSAVDTATGYGLDNRRGRISNPVRVQTGSGTHPASYPIGTRGSYPASKATGE
jgi:hypothetical protein